MTPESLCMGCMGERGTDLLCPVCGWLEGSPAESLLQLPPRTVLDGRYLIGKALGQGGFGITYLACDLNLECKLAVKEYFPRDICTRARDDCTVQPVTREERTTFQDALKSFVDEGRTLARFRDHPGVVSVLGFFQENGTGYIVMAYAEGMTLKEYLNSRGGTIPFDEALRLLLPVMDALQAVHRADMLHRDVSPDNIYLTRNSQIKLLDFGNARYMLGERSRSFSAVLKPGYAPEEQFRRQGRQGPWTDVYALAATFYRALTGHTPPDAPDRLAHDELVPPSQQGVLIPLGAERALLKALAVRQQDRFQSVVDFQRELTEIPGPPPPPLPLPRPWVDAKLWKRVALAALILALLALTAYRIFAPPKTGTLTVGTNIAEAQILIDGDTQPEWLAPRTFPNLKAGPHSVTAKKDGFQAVTRNVDVKPGEVVSLEMVLPRQTLPQYGKLAVSANVVGAEISIDSQTQPGWVTPQTIDQLQAGPHQVTVKKDGYEAASQSITIEAGGSVSLPFDLKPAHGQDHAVQPGQFGKLTVTASVTGAKILINGRSQSDWLTPHTFESLSAGSYAVTVVKDGYQTASKTILIRDGAPSLWNAPMLPRLANLGVGELVVTSNVPGAKIVMDGADTGFVTPHTFPSQPARTHTVSLLKDGYDANGGSVNVEAGKSITANILLSPPTGRFTLEVVEVSESNREGVPIPADVDIDGQPYGRSPVSTYLSPGTHHYKVVAGSRSEEGSFEVQSGVGISKVRVRFHEGLTPSHP
jgi:serine/threonine protein kinase